MCRSEGSQLEIYIRTVTLRNYNNGDTVQADGNTAATATTSVLLSSQETGAEHRK